ncbi:hypothetical protein [Nocardiopsis lambiniae]|uniref:HEAT repeat domain-containing protein n=1 Tax=Nocardiopsis lambiniae TaxID=3075539 RepID=A0ABU2MBL2_9ACTN|nr:hypothetical protein [Nocardiopsis sp. DSM 44743]MDT0329965.1 hypothetical protein [Nocardiopsis sp. DSM 44743]
MSPTEPTRASAPSLLSTVEPLSATARMRALSDFARRRAGTPELTAIIRDLEAHTRGTGFAPHAQRAFASHLALVSRDLDAVARHLASPHHDLRRAALRAVRALPVPDEVVIPVLRDAPTELRRALYRTLLHARRTALADRLLPRVHHDHGAPEAAALLPACSPPVVAARLPDLAHAVLSWRRLARRHPDTLVAYLHALREAGRDDEPADRTRLLRALDPLRPEAVADLATGHPGRRYHAYPHAARVHDRTRGDDARFYPTRYPVTLYGDRSVRSLMRTMRGFPEAARPVLRAMEPEVRARYLEAFLESRDALRIPSLTAHLDLLAPRRAEQEARSALERLRRSRRNGRRDDPHLALGVLAFLPHAEVAGTLTEAAGSGDVDRRARGLAALLKATVRTGDPALIADVLLTRAVRARAERDPVRRVLLSAVAATPPPLLEASLPALERLLADTVQARDTSADTRRALRDIAARLLRHPGTGTALTAWALEVYTRLVERFGGEGLGESGRPRANPPWWTSRRRGSVVDLEPHLDQVLPRGTEHELYRRLAPVLAAARERGDHLPTVLVVRELGRRARNLPELRAHLRAAVSESGDRAVAGAAARLHLSGPDAAREALRLTGTDPDTVRIPRVWRLLVREHGTDAVLTAMMTATRVRDGHAWIPDVDRRAARLWPLRLAGAVAEHLSVIAADPALSVDDRERALLRLGDLPRTTHRLWPYRTTDDIVLREAALRALGRNHDRNLESLLDAMDGPRSRAAAPALSLRALATPPSELGPALARTLHGPAKVTVRKTAARLLAHHRPPGAVEHLARILVADGLHRDVRAAVFGALVRCLDDPVALPALAEHAPRSADTETRLALLGPGPLRCPPEHRAAMAALVASLPEAEETHWRFGYWTSRWVSWGGAPDVDALNDAAGDMGRPFGRTRVGLHTLWREGIALDRAHEVVDRLLDLVPGPSAGPLVRVREGTDTPHRRLTVLLGDFVAAVYTGERDDPGRFDGRVRSVVRSLERRDEYLPEAMDLVIGRVESRIGRDEGRVRPEEITGLLLWYLRLGSRTAHSGGDVPLRPVKVLCDRRGRDEIPWDVRAEIVRGLLRAATEEERIRYAAGVLALGLVRRALTECGPAAPWSELLTRIADLGAPALRAAAWRVAAD